MAIILPAGNERVKVEALAKYIEQMGSGGASVAPETGIRAEGTGVMLFEGSDTLTNSYGSQFMIPNVLGDNYLSQPFIRTDNGKSTINIMEAVQYFMDKYYPNDPSTYEKVPTEISFVMQFTGRVNVYGDAGTFDASKPTYVSFMGREQVVPYQVFDNDAQINAWATITAQKSFYIDSMLNDMEDISLFSSNISLRQLNGAAFDANSAGINGGYAAGSVTMIDTRFLFDT